MKKYLWVFFILILAACGSSTSTEEKPKEESKQAEQKQDEQEKEDVAEEIEEDSDEKAKEDETLQDRAEESGEWEEADFGKVKIVGVGYNDEVGIDGTDSPGKPLEMGPMKLSIDSLTVLDIEPTGAAKETFFEDKEKVKAVIMGMKAENTDEGDVTFYPENSQIVTNTGEQLDSEMLITDEIGGDFLGKVTKEGDVWWILNNPDKDITSVKIVIHPPYTSDSFDDLGEEKRLEFEVVSFEEAKKKEKD